MKIGMIVRGVYPQQVGGQEIQAFMIINKLTKEKNDVFVISDSFKQKIVSKSNRLRFYRMPIPKIPGLRFIIKIILNVLQMSRIHKKNRLNVIHGHGTIAEGVSTILFSKLFKVDSIITIHGRGVTNFSKKFPKIVNFILKNANSLITTNDFLKNQVKSHTNKEIEIVPNSISIKRFKPLNKKELLETKFSYLKDKFILLTVSRLDKIKNIDLIIDLINKLRDSIPNLKLLIIGEGKLKKSLIKKVKKLGLSSIVHFLGKVDHNKLPKYYSISDAFLMLSEMEGQGITVLEAMACECIVIANNVGGITHSIKNGENGFLIDNNNEENLKSTILKIYKKELDLNFIKKSAKARIIKDFNWDENFKKLIKIYKKFI